MEGEYGLGLLWSLAFIVSENARFRTDTTLRAMYMPFDPILFFADAGNGDQFAFVRKVRSYEVFVWNHEDDSRMWAAPGLEQYLVRWCDGTLEI